MPSNLGAIEGCVGRGAATEFAAFVRERDLQDPEEILANPSSYRHPPRGDQRWAVMNAVVLAAASSITAARWASAWEFLAALRDTYQSGDVALVGARFLVHYRTRGQTPLQPTPAMIGFMALLGLSGI